MSQENTAVQEATSTRDIAGAERGNPPRLYRESFEIAKRGHGCSAVEDKALLRRLARGQILVECCLTSNYQTGAVKRGEPHPVYTFLEHGVPVAICTDNTTVSNTSQGAENTLLLSQLSLDEVAGIHDRARSHSFIPAERHKRSET